MNTQPLRKIDGHIHLQHMAFEVIAGVNQVLLTSRIPAIERVMKDLEAIVLMKMMAK